MEAFRQYVSEFEIDWLICLELNGNDAFRSWLTDRVFKSSVVHVRAYRSIVHGNLGESDLIWLVEDSNRVRHMALIENKIDAIAQYRQHERYTLRGEEYRVKGICCHFKTALIAPRNYHSHDSDCYQVRINYEDVRDWFEAQADERSAYIVTLFNAAIEKRIYQLPPDPAISSFRRSIWELARREFPEIELLEPKPGRETWVIQSYGSASVKYKMFSNNGVYSRAVVDLELPGKAAEVEALQLKYAIDLESLSAHIAPTGKSASIRIEVPPISPPEFDESAAREALRAWSRLLTWWRVSANSR